MLHLIIDGYNLIRQIPQLEKRERESLAAGRDLLIDKLKKYRHLKSHKITVVFDGAGGLSEFAASYKEGGIAICFSPVTQTADDVIKDMALEFKTRAIVVSSDRSIMDFAKMCGCAVIDSVDFYAKLKMADLMALKGPTEDDAETKPQHKRWMTYKKGPSRKLPKKVRQNKNKLDKL